MKVVIPTNDKINVEPKTGHATYFAVFEINNQSFELVELLNNTHEHGNHHDGEHNHGQKHQHGHDEQAKMFKNYDAILVHHLGSHFKKSVSDYNVNVFFTKKETIEEAIKDFLANW